MKRKLLWIVGICVSLLALVFGVMRYIQIQARQNDPNWQIAEQIYKLENALKEVDDDYECQSISKVTPVSYADSEGNIITYYCC